MRQHIVRLATSRAPVPPRGWPQIKRTTRMSLSCLAAAACFVVASSIVGSISPSGAAQPTWAPMEAPLPAGVDTAGSILFAGVTCPAVGSCVAVGSYDDTSALQHGVLETVSGGTATTLKAPLPANADPSGYDSLSAVSCWAVGSCVAVGFYFDYSTGTEQGLIETLAGGSWTPSEALIPTNANLTQYTFLSSVSCPTPNGCVAVGQYTDASGASGGLIETLSGESWTTMQAPQPANANSDPALVLSSVTCAAAGECTAIGSYDDSSASASRQGLIETLSAGSWSPTEAPLPVGAGTVQYPTLSALSCPTVDFCVAVGYFYTGSAYSGLIETLSAGTWTASQVPLPANSANSPSLTSVTCPTVGSCVAAGSYSAGYSLQSAYFYTLASGVWTASDMPVPAYATSVTYTALSAVTCATAGSCVAVGLWNSNVTGNSESLFETLSGGVWAPSGAPLPANANPTYSASLSVLACPAADSCVAAGSYSVTNRDQRGLLEIEGASTAPTITSIAPSSGPVSGGTGVTITGTNLSSPTSVTFGGFPGTVTGGGDTSITVTTPPGIAGLVDVVVTTAGGVATASGGFMYVVAPQITSASSTTFIKGSFATFTVIATGTPDPSITNAGGLPLGVTFSAGVLSGTPLTDGIYPITFTAHNGVVPDAIQHFTLTVNAAPKITSAASTTFTKGVTKSFTVTTTGRPTPTITETGVLPTGVSFKGRVLSGKSTVSGVFHITFTAHNGVGSDATQKFTLTVSGLYVTTTSLPNGKRGVWYKLTLHAAGGPVPYTWKRLTTLPKGLSLSAAGVLSGTPAKSLASKTYSFEVQVTDSTMPAHKSATAIVTLKLS